MDIKSLFSSFFNTKKKFLVSSIIAFLSISAISALVIFTSTKLSLRQKNSMAFVPDDAVYYVEFVNFRVFCEEFKKSKTGKKIINSEAWSNFLNVPEALKINNILYLLKLKSANIANPESLYKLFDGPAAFSIYKKNNYLVTAKINFATKIGLKLLSSFKKDKKVPEVKKGNTGDNNYKDLYQEDKIEFNNLTITSFSIGENKVYLTIFGDFLFISDNIDILQQSLQLASSKNSNSLKNLEGVDDLYSDVTEKSCIFYVNNHSASISPLMPVHFQLKGLALRFDLSPAGLITGDIYNIGFVKQKEDLKIKQNGFPWENYLTSETVLTIYSRNDGAAEYFNHIGLLSDDLKNIKNGLAAFSDAAGIDREKYFLKNSGYFFAIDSIDFERNYLIPFFSMGFDTGKKGEKLIKSIFKTGRPSEEKYLGKSFKSYSTGNYSFYKPALYSLNDKEIVFSHNRHLKVLIGAEKGNMGVLTDIKSYDHLGKYKKAPYHLIINIQKAIKSIENFYLYGASKNSNYSSKTITKDVMSLFKVFDDYKYIHFAYGEKDIQSGKAIILN